MSENAPEILARFGSPWRAGARLWVLAPFIPLLVFGPELIQHAVEWKLGMFASKVAFKALQFDPLRLGVGIAKQFLVFVAIAAAARRSNAADEPVLWGRLAVTVMLMTACALTPMALRGHLQDPAIEVLGWILLVPFLLLFVALIASILGDKGMSLRQTVRSGWRRLPLLIAIPLLPMAVGQWVHRQNHYLALGRPDGLIALVMIWDALWVATFACWTGAALAAGYGPALAKR